jgi:uncharacterized protein (DUF433 family)
MLRLAPRIVVDERVRFGRPVIEGSRVPVDVVLGKLATGMTAEAVADEYGLTREDVLAALAYAAHTLAAEEVRAGREVARFLVDEDLPRSLAPLLRAAALDASDVRDPVGVCWIPTVMATRG